MKLNKILTLEYRIRRLEKFFNERVAEGNMPKYFYHGTSGKAAEQILKQGLSSAKYRKAKVVHPGLTKKDKVYLCSNLQATKDWANMAYDVDFVVLQIDSKYLDPDKLIGDRNAFGGMFGGRLSKADRDEIENIRFDDNGETIGYRDFEYEGIIPPEAIKLVWRSDKDSVAAIKDAYEEGDPNIFVKNWDKWKDVELGDGTAAQLFTNLISQIIGTPHVWTNPRVGKIIKQIPVKILNTEVPYMFDNKKTVLFDIIGVTSDSYMLDILNFLSGIKGISDLNIKLAWERWNKRNLSKNIDTVKEFPKKFLDIGKPYIPKKYHSELGL